MESTKSRKLKVQRGVSLAIPLYDRIASEAEATGKTWNETVEAALATTFLPVEMHMHK
jgi:hypothetical protein